MLAAASIEAEAAPRRRLFTRTGAAITGLATVAALWLGLAAPSVSPVAPSPAAQPATSNVADQDVDDTGFAGARMGRFHR